MNLCKICGYHYSEQSCPACSNPAKYLTLDQIEALAEKYGDASIFAIVLRASAARTLGKRTSPAKADSSRNNGRLGGRPRKKRWPIGENPIAKARKALVDLAARHNR